MTKEEQKKLFQEWTEDYTARREEDRREREGVPPAGPCESWPSEIAKKARREKQAGQDQGKSAGGEIANGHSM